MGAAHAAQTTDFKSYRLLTEIHIGGGGGHDYLSIDSAEGRLYVTHESQIEVIDLATDKLVGTVANTPGVHEFALAPDLQRGFASNGRNATASIVDLKSLQTLGTVSTGESPDAALFESVHNEVYTFNGRGRSATVFSAKTGTVLATIALPGKPEFAVNDAALGRLFNNIEDQDEVVAIDTSRHEIAATWPAAPCASASGLALDPARHRLFLGCENKLMVMMDANTGKVLASVPIEGGVDANAYDPGTQLAFSANGQGTVTIARAGEGVSLKVVQTLPTQNGARTMALDPTTHRIYLATDERGVANSFKIMVFGAE